MRGYPFGVRALIVSKVGLSKKKPKHTVFTNKNKTNRLDKGDVFKNKFNMFFITTF